MELNDDILSKISDFIKPEEHFNIEYQQKLLKILIEDPNFTIQIIDILEDKFFDGYYQNIVNNIIKYFNKYKSIPTFFTIKSFILEKVKNNQKEELAISTAIDEIQKTEIDGREINYIKETTFKFFKRQKVKNALIKITYDWKKNDYDKMMDILEEAVTFGKTKSIGHDYTKQVKERFLFAEKEERYSILPVLDPHISGGIAPGELFVILAPTGGGKSMFLSNCALNLALNNKNVVYFSLELSEFVVAKRLDSMITKIPLDKIMYYPHYVEEKVKNIKTKIIIKSYPDGYADTTNFISHINSVEKELGVKIDAIIVDYADNMKIEGDFRLGLIDTYRKLRSLAIEYNVPVLTASQTNSDGYNKSEIELNMTSEAKGKNNIADIIVGFGRDEKQEKDNKAVIKITKNRAGKKNIKIECNFDPTISLIW